MISAATQQLVTWLGSGVIAGGGMGLGFWRAASENRQSKAEAALPALEATRAAFDGLVQTVDALRHEVERLRSDRLVDERAALEAQRRADAREHELLAEVGRLRSEVDALRRQLVAAGLTPLHVIRDNDPEGAP